MKILILGGDGYLGWPAAMCFSNRGNEVAVVDSFVKREWEKECGVIPLFPIPDFQARVEVWHRLVGGKIQTYIGDLTNYAFVLQTFSNFKPHVIIHFGEQPSAPYSMMDQRRAVLTQTNNIVGTLNVLFAMRDVAPEAHLIKLGTMGEYGTPNIDIEEGFIEITHHGRTDTLPFPKQAGSFYHLSKVHDSHNVMFATNVWNLRATDLNQGVVYGVETEETRLDERLNTSFHYDEIFGTVLNRFCVQAVLQRPLTIYGKGEQKRGFLNIIDALQCVELAVLYPPSDGKYRVFNQFTEVFAVRELAEIVIQEAAKLGLRTSIEELPNPRTEKENHYYNPKHSQLIDLGLRPTPLSTTLLNSMLIKIMKYRNRIDPDVLLPRVQWSPSTAKLNKQFPVAEKPVL